MNGCGSMCPSSIHSSSASACSSTGWHLSFCDCTITQLYIIASLSRFISIIYTCLYWKFTLPALTSWDTLKFIVPTVSIQGNTVTLPISVAQSISVAYFSLHLIHFSRSLASFFVLHSHVPLWLNLSVIFRILSQLLVHDILSKCCQK